jgi:protein-tyrosine kinase
MSIVEKTLQKLQASGVKPRNVNPPITQPAPPAGRGASVEAQEPPAASRRASVGQSQKTVRIDHDRLRASGLLPPEHQQREIAHEYRTLKRPLIRNILDAGPENNTPGAPTLRSIMVSSALPGEGKTFTSINLALSLALEKDYSVVLVDGDVPKPHVTNTFGLQNEPGLLDVLSDPALPLESVIVPTDITGLSILPVGRRAESAPELLASARMRHVMSRLEQAHPHALVVVDSPPILLTSEARVLASLFGQVMLVVRAASTPQQAVLDSLEIIGDGPRVGLVLNQAVHDGAVGTYYGYGSYYGNNPEDGAGKGLRAVEKPEGSFGDR